MTSSLRLQVRQYWKQKYGVQAPAVLFFLGSGTQPIMYKGNTLNVSDLMLRHRWPIIPQLEADSVQPLGCAWGPGVKIEEQIQACAVLVSLMSQVPILKSSTILNFP